MKALQYTAIGKPPEIREVPTPQPGPGEVLIKMTAAGVCHSDEHFMSLPAEKFGFELPLTSGTRARASSQGSAPLQAASRRVTRSPCMAPGAAGTAGPARPAPRTTASGRSRGPASTPPGSWPSTCSSRARGISSRSATSTRSETSPLTDAGLTPYHAIKPSLPKLVPGSTAVVIGAGGLGHLAIQMLRALSPAQVIALDIGEDKIAFAREVGAHAAFLSDPSSIEVIRDLTGGRGADAVFNFVGIQATADLAAKLVGPWSDIIMVGLGPGAIPVSVDTLPGGTSVRAPVWGTRPELIEVLDLARSGAIKVETERFSLEDGPEAYARLHARTLRGRAVLVP
jgi:propanol-preferring alcohol dehydrogenase